MLAGVQRRARDAAALLQIDLPRVPDEVAGRQARLAPAQERWLGGGRGASTDPTSSSSRDCSRLTP
jgi:hypothetical protein